MKLPAKVFVKWEYNDAEDPDLVAGTTKHELTEKGEAVHIGEYRLVRTSTIRLKEVETDAENH